MSTACRRPSGEAGASRTERLVVLAVVLVLAGVVGFVLPRIEDRAGQTGCAQDRQALERAVLQYEDRNGRYPRDLTLLAEDGFRDDDVAGRRLVREDYALTYDPTDVSISTCSR